MIVFIAGISRDQRQIAGSPPPSRHFKGEEGKKEERRRGRKKNAAAKMRALRSGYGYIPSRAANIYIPRKSLAGTVQVREKDAAHCGAGASSE